MFFLAVATRLLIRYLSTRPRICQGQDRTFGLVLLVDGAKAGVSAPKRWMMGFLELGGRRLGDSARGGEAARGF
jgi:hypothetical protein